MGYQKIQAKRKELESKTETYQQFLKVASTFNSRLTDIEKAHEALEKQKEDTAKAIQRLNPAGIPEFQALQKEMVACCGSDEPRAISLNAAERFLKDYQAGIDQELDEWMSKLTAAFPAKVEPGMSFKNYNTKTLLVITSGPTKATNPNLSGDVAVWFKGKLVDNGREKDLSLSLADLSPKRGWKFIKV